MEEAGFVSMWIGNAPTLEKLEQYLQPKYSKDGDLRPSQFMIDFALPQWDESCREAVCNKKKMKTVREVLAGFSYDDQLIPQFERLAGPTLAKAANTVVLLYNFNCQSKVLSSTDGPVALRFVGVAEYRH